MNCLYSVLFHGQTLERDDIMVGNWMACTDCARAIVQSGISTIIRHATDADNGKWGDSLVMADDILTQGGVEIIDHKGKLGIEPILRNGELFHP